MLDCLEDDWIKTVQWIIYKYKLSCKCSCFCSNLIVYRMPYTVCRCCMMLWPVALPLVAAVFASPGEMLQHDALVCLGNPELFFKDVDTTRLNKIILRWCQVIDGTPFECYGAHTNVDPARLVPRCNCTNTEALRVTCNHSVGICQFYPCCYLTAACAIGHSLSLHPTACHGWRVSQFMLAAGATRKEHCWLLSAHVNLTDAQRG